ncbi:MAG: ABC transporter permease [Rubricoccaceae bacterium]
MAWGALRANGLRSALTLGGMAVGVFSVIASVTAVTVLERTLLSNLSAMGATTLTITRTTSDGPPREGEARRAPLTYAQAERLRARARLAVSVSPSVQHFGEQVRGGGAQTDPNVTVLGADADYAVNNGLSVRAGRFVNEDDVRTARAVAVLGSSLAERLFAGREALGQEVRAGAQRYTVVGVLEPRSGGFGLGDPNNNLVAPVTRVLAAYSLFESDVAIDVRAPSPELLAATQDEAVGLLRAIRRVPPEAESDFAVTSGATFAEGFRSFTRALALGGAGIGLIALLAAGVGVMNIMLVSVTERTREIGVRKALGATPRAIRQQFLVEAVLLCQVGGLAGVLLGVAGGNVAALLLRDAPAFPLGWALGAFAGVTLVALAFGVYPAAKAARLSPIDALRYE